MEFMPIMAAKTIKKIPMALIEPHGRQAQLNHWQTLQRLAERGGLDPSEAVAIIEDRPFRKMDQAESERQLSDIVSKWNASQQPKESK